ncbi:hypothetical protein Ciccas_004080 [Cichlidogyrus casuarinus]|uniref:Uncharacterized protein n=1 Tax=Cichlidogyrus casuarinus TaxID=1844966 RepID=A0ABD2QCZ7_9PLAT
MSLGFETSNPSDYRRRSAKYARRKRYESFLVGLSNTQEKRRRKRDISFTHVYVEPDSILEAIFLRLIQMHETWEQTKKQQTKEFILRVKDQAKQIIKQQITRLSDSDQRKELQTLIESKFIEFGNTVKTRKTLIVDTYNRRGDILANMKNDSKVVYTDFNKSLRQKVAQLKSKVTNIL